MQQSLPKLQIKLFGTEKITYGDISILNGKKKITKAMKLLLILVYCGREGISSGQLIENLYGHEEVTDVANNLRVTLHRLKKLLEKAGLPEYEYIERKENIYYWNGPIEIESDLEKFKSLIEKAKQDTDEEKQLIWLKEACQIYNGEFLERLSGDEWVMMEAVQCKTLYTNALQQVCETLMEQKEYTQIIKLVEPACQLYPFDEWQSWQIDCYIAMNQYKEAMKIYDKTARMFVEELGIGPSPKMMEQFKNMSGHISYQPQILDEIKQEFRQDVLQKGALFCTVPGFRDVCRAARRGMERSGQSIFLLLCTLIDTKGHPMTASDKLEEMAGELHVVLRNTLRKSDSFTKYSQAQFLVMLVGTNEENCQIVIDRIEKRFTEGHKSWAHHIDYSVSSLWDIEY